MNYYFRGEKVRLGDEIWRYGTMGKVISLDANTLTVKFPDRSRVNFRYDGVNPSTGYEEAYWQNPIVMSPPKPFVNGTDNPKQRYWLYAKKQMIYIFNETQQEFPNG